MSILTDSLLTGQSTFACPSCTQQHTRLTSLSLFPLIVATQSLVFVVLASFRWLKHTCHHSSMLFACTPSYWTHDWLAVWGKKAALANKTWWRRSWNAGGSCIKTLLSARSSAEPQVRLSANLQTRTATNLRWVQFWSNLDCLLKTGWRERREREKCMKRLNCYNVLHRETAWCWKPGLCFSRTRCSFVRRTSRRQHRPGTLTAAPFPKEWNQVPLMYRSIKHSCVFRTSKESVADGVSLWSDDAQRLFNAVKELLQIPSDEQDHQAADGDGYSLALIS